MSQEAEPLITHEMLGLFVVFGADIILFVVLLGVGGVISLWTTGLVTGAVLAVYGVWVLLRWRRLRRDDTVDPVETLKQRYAAGELTDAEFEHRLSSVLDSSPESGLSETDADLSVTGRDSAVRDLSRQEDGSEATSERSR